MTFETQRSATGSQGAVAGVRAVLTYALCQIGLHRYRHKDLTMPPGSIPEGDGVPANPFTVGRPVRICRGCGRLDPTYARIYPDLSNWDDVEEHVRVHRTPFDRWMLSQVEAHRQRLAKLKS